MSLKPLVPGRPVCVHCGERVACRPRRLCSRCDTWTNRHAYPSLRTPADDLPDLNALAPRLPPGPTTARPGSEAKVAVMERRLAAGFHLHHPDDEKGEE